MAVRSEVAEPVIEAVKTPGFSVFHQKVDLEIDFQSQRIKGRTEITIHPDSPDLKTIKLNLRQCKVNLVKVNGTTYTPSHSDPYDKAKLHSQATANQHHLLAERIAPAIKIPPEYELTLNLKKIRIERVHQVAARTETSGTVQINTVESGDADVVQSTRSLADSSVAEYTPLTIVVSFVSKPIQDGLHFVAHTASNGRYPCVYTRNTAVPGSASCIFPCVDALTARCTWDITIKTPRTIADVLRVGQPYRREQAPNGAESQISAPADGAREMLVICSGEMTDEIVDKVDPTMKSVTFTCTSSSLSAQQIGFAVGPFEYVNLSELRGAQEEEDLGKNAVEMHGYCLPGRTGELRNTCLPTTQAMDFMVRKYAACPFMSYTMCFVEDLPSDISICAGLGLCSDRLLYPEDIIDSSQDVTRKLVQAIVSQWVGIDIVPQEPTDTWVTIGISYYVTELFMKELCGNNEFRYRMKRQTDLVCEIDRDRPSLATLGTLLHVHPSELDFIATKAPLVLFILDRRIAKISGASKMPTIIGRILTRRRLGELENGELSTDLFQRTCERFYHAKIDDFLRQWVQGAGCPRFKAGQKFNKKKLVVEMVIEQVQGLPEPDRELQKDTFMRDVLEEFRGVDAASPQNVFTGPMTIRIHEADGTPYEHIVEIKEAKTMFEVPYNTKYKRLKRSKKQRERNALAAATDPSEGENDSLLYCLGDILQSEQEVADWKLADWAPEDEERMNNESYEWIRLDADFEWISQIQFLMPGYMFASQLQQDRDIVAQLESIRHLNMYKAHPLVSTILLRTMMDRRYFHGVRTTAAKALVKHAEEELGYIGLFHLKKAFEESFCLSEHNSRMTRPNDFSNRSSYNLQCQIVEAIASVRDTTGQAPREVKEFLLDKLKFNDNSANMFSDCHYVATLMESLTAAMATKPATASVADIDLMDTDAEDERTLEYQLEQDCLAEIDRYRRTDEWTSSYHNLYSRTALQCQSRLSQVGIGRTTPIHFLQYTRPGNFDMLRMTAFGCLAESNIFDSPSVLRYFIFCLASDPSPWIRENLRRVFGRALASKAIGEANPAPEIPQDGLIIEDTAADTRQRDLARRHSVEAAMEALNPELEDNETLKTSLWAAVNSDLIGLLEIQSLLDFCKMIYEPIDEMKGKLVFSQTSKIRTKKIGRQMPRGKSATPSDARSATSETGAPVKQPFKLKLKLPGSGSAVTSARGESPVQAEPSPLAQQPPLRRSLTIKFSRPSLPGPEE